MKRDQCSKVQAPKKERKTNIKDEKQSFFVFFGHLSLSVLISLSLFSFILFFLFL